MCKFPRHILCGSVPQGVVSLQTDSRKRTPGHIVALHFHTGILTPSEGPRAIGIYFGCIVERNVRRRKRPADTLFLERCLLHCWLDGIENLRDGQRISHGSSYTIR
ncbi:hypothetical protein VTK56DRAFT_5512 [Thermocarpiscus australiensis]